MCLILDASKICLRRDVPRNAALCCTAPCQAALWRTMSYHLVIRLVVIPMMIPVFVKRIPLEKKTRGNSSPQSTESGAGEQFLLLDCTARTRAKKCFFRDADL